jgi:hypothetical protein
LLLYSGLVTYWAVEAFTDIIKAKVIAWFKTRKHRLHYQRSLRKNSCACQSKECIKSHLQKFLRSRMDSSGLLRLTMNRHFVSVIISSETCVAEHDNRLLTTGRYFRSASWVAHMNTDTCYDMIFDMPAVERFIINGCKINRLPAEISCPPTEIESKPLLFSFFSCWSYNNNSSPGTRRLTFRVLMGEINRMPLWEGVASEQAIDCPSRNVRRCVTSLLAC